MLQRVAFMVTCWFSFGAHLALVALVSSIEAWYYGFVAEKIDPVETFPDLGERLELEGDEVYYTSKV